ncbi:MAG: Mov34/MPN/PAD-1 family protein [Candidatus Saliniplasma sp.]
MAMIFKKKDIRGISKRTLKMIMESAKDAHPNEFAAGMREIDGVISELILVPGTISGKTSALLRMRQLPIDYSVIGVVHSHPSRNFSPSRKDLLMFGRYGRVHIIAGYPYDMDSWQAYDYDGNKIELDVLD